MDNSAGRGEEKDEKNRMVKEIRKIYRNSAGGGGVVGRIIWAMWLSKTSQKDFIKNDFDTSHN